MTGAGASPATRGAGTWRWTLSGFLVLWALISVWSVTVPKYGGIDEPSHAVKAAATARGELLGKPAYTPSELARLAIPSRSSVVTFRVPRTIANGAYPACFEPKPDVPASCVPATPTGSTLVPANTYTGRYPPLYYAIVGLPSLLTSRSSLLLWMRLVSGALSAMFLAAAIVSAAQARKARWTVVGAIVALTPMELFLAATVNPSGLEISSALCLWTSGLALVTGPREQHRRRLLVWSAIAAGTFVQVRGLSPLLVAVTAVGLALVVGRGRVVDLVRRRDVQVALGVVAVCALFALVWIFGDGALQVQQSDRLVPANASDLTVLRDASHVALNTKQLIGDFGWLTIHMPSWSYVLWEAAVVALVVGCLVRRSYRAFVALAWVTVVTLVLPTALAYAKAHQYGIVGEGRYILPVAIGVPVLAAYGWAHEPPYPRRLRIGTIVAGAAISTATVSGYVQLLHRYRTGLDAPIWVLHAPWEPPLPWLLLVVACLVLQAALLVWWLLVAGVLPSTLRPAGLAPSRLRPTGRRQASSAQGVAS